MKQDSTSRRTYRHVVRAILSLISDQQLGRDAPLPTINELRYLPDGSTVSRNTVRRALQELSQEGVVYSVHGGGTFVLDPNAQVDDGATIAALAAEIRSLHTRTRQIEDLLRECLPAASRGETAVP